MNLIRVGDKLVETFLLALVIGESSQPLKEALPGRATQVKVVGKKDTECCWSARDVGWKGLVCSVRS